MNREGKVHVGDKFGRLTVIKPTKFKYRAQSVWECRCDCGERVCVPQGSLVGGNTKSCGCLRKEKTAIRPILCQRPNKNNHTGFRGVCYLPSSNRYLAQIMANGKNHYLGRYKKLTDAVKARRRAEEEYHLPMIERYLEGRANT